MLQVKDNLFFILIYDSDLIHILLTLSHNSLLVDECKHRDRANLRNHVCALTEPTPDKPPKKLVFK